MARELSYVPGAERTAAGCFFSALVSPGTHTTQPRQFPGADLPGEASGRSQRGACTPGLDDSVLQLS